jgi:hypothetical protein
VNIADLFYTFRGDGARLQKDAQVEGAKAGTSLAKSTAASFKKSWSGAEIGKGFVQGLGLAGGLGAAQLFTRGIHAVTDALGDSVAAAREDQASRAALGASLRASIKDWNGNTAAIEKEIDARMRLGFTDEEQRLSLQRLLPVFKDVNKALEVQRVAMDLARFKRISLADATVSLITQEAGQFRGLKQLIGSTKDITNSTEALAAVRLVAADAAETMAATDEGRLLASQIRQAEALEKLGYVLLPVVTEGSIQAADATVDFVEGAQRLEGGLSDAGANLDQFIGGLADFVGVENHLTERSAQHWALVASNIERATDDSTTAVEGMRGVIEPATEKVEIALDDTGEAADDMADEIRAAALGSSEAFDKMKRSMVDDANELIDDAYDPLITQDRLRATQAEIAAQREILASSKSTAAQKRDARDRLHELTKDNAQYLLELAEAGDTNSKAYKDGIRELKTQIKNATGPAKTALQEVLDKIREVERAGKVVPINVIVAGQTTQWAKNLAGNMRATGGPQRAGVPYVVGERGPEIHVPETNGRILSTAQSIEALSGGRDGGDTFSVTVAGLLPVATVADVRREMKHISDVRRINRPRFP